MSLSKPVVNIIKRDHTGSPVLDEENLKQLLIDTDAKDIPVAFYSICGTSRLGKSFLWNQFVRYLKKKHVFLTNLDSTENLETFFEWKGGDDRHTDGILVNKHPFILRTSKYDKIALFLMDTQGMYDNTESRENGGMIFTLSFLIASLQVYNVQSKLESTQLQNSYKAIQSLESLRKSKSNTKPFQSLMLLVRDWRRKSSYPLGLEGGTEFVNNWLRSNDLQADDQRNVRREIQKKFKKISGFLLPEPGDKIVDMKPRENNCRIKDVDKNFYKYIDKLFRLLCQEDNIALKTLDGKVMSGEELYDFIVPMAQKVAEFPGVKESFGTFINNDYRADMRIVTYRALKMYIDSVCTEFKNHVKKKDHTYDRSRLTQHHYNLKNDAIENFNQSSKPGEKELHNRWRNHLEVFIEKNYNKFKDCVESEKAFDIALRDYNEVLRSSIRNSTDEANEISEKALDDAIKKIKKMVTDESITDQCCSQLKKVAETLLEEHLSQIKFKDKVVNVMAIVTAVAGGVIGAGNGGLLGAKVGAKIGFKAGLIVSGTLAGVLTGLAATDYRSNIDSLYHCCYDVLLGHRDPVEQMIKMSWGIGDDDLSCIEAEIVLGLSYGVVRFRMENIP